MRSTLLPKTSAPSYWAGGVEGQAGAKSTDLWVSQMGKEFNVSIKTNSYDQTQKGVASALLYAHYGLDGTYSPEQDTGEGRAS